MGPFREVRPCRRKRGQSNLCEAPSGPFRQIGPVPFSTTAAAEKRRAAQIARRLAAAYPDAKCSFDFRTPLELLVATILSAQCTDVRVNKVTKSLFRKYPAAGHYARAGLADLERDIQTTGFFRNKAKSIQNACRACWSSTTASAQGNGKARRVAGRGAEDGQRRPRHGLWSGRRRGGRYARRPDRPPARPNCQKDPEKIERALMRQFAAEGVDRPESPPHPARPPLLHGTEAEMQGVPAGIALSENWSPEVGLRSSVLGLRQGLRPRPRPKTAWFSPARKSAASWARTS